MISWMQKHNKYLVWTIWVATITFIGAGFVGWGSYNLGSKANAVAKVGEVPIKQARLNMVYSNLYNRYREMFKGNFDDKKAEELGVLQQAFSIVEPQAKLLNYAKDIGIIVSNEEVARVLETLPVFQNNGVFDKKVYETYLKSHGLNPKIFENSLRDEITIQKLMKLLHLPLLPLEEQTVAAAFHLSDKIKYRILTPDDVNVSIDDAQLASYWEAHKEKYLTPQRYKLALVWIETTDLPVDEKELKNFYDNNSFNYIGDNGQQLDFEAAKDRIIRDLRLKKGKKSAQLAYIDIKKGKRTLSETLTLDVNDSALSPQTWQAITEAQKGALLKPKTTGTRYGIIKILDVIPPHPMPFKEAKEAVTQDYLSKKRKETLTTLSQKTLKTIDSTDTPVSNYLSLSTKVTLDGLNLQEMSQFLQKLFTSDKEKGIITVSNKHIVYSIVEQTFVSPDKNESKAEQAVASRLKQDVFDRRFLEVLDKLYPVEVYVKGLTP